MITAGVAERIAGSISRYGRTFESGTSFRATSFELPHVANATTRKAFLARSRTRFAFLGAKQMIGRIS
jgi:hypothetical protein